MEEKVKALDMYFESKMKACAGSSKRLLGDDRTDEGTFEKIKGNIYEIFQTVLSAAVKNSKEDAGAVRDFFEAKLEEIPQNWKLSYEKAKAHGDVEKMQIETIKLDTAREIKGEFTKIWEGSK